jgi:tetratricopeptide (TPR) repeat protein/predicted nucleic acid-binding Zn ribbon protein
VNTNRRDAPHQQENNKNRLRSPVPEQGEKNSKVCTTTLDPGDQKNSKAQSEKELIEKEGPSRKSEIDLSYASPKTNFGGDKRKIEPEEEKDSILIQSPTEAVFEAETKPLEESLPKEKLKTIPSEKRKPHPKRTKTEKSRKAASGGKRKTEGKRVPKKTKPHISSSTPEQVIMSKGVAYLEGNMIRMAGGIKLHPGDQIKVGEKEFILKAKKRQRKTTYLFILILAAIVLLVSSQLLKGKSSGRLIGIVLEEKGKTLLPNAEIQIKELGKKVKSNQLGFFMFDILPSGSYTLQTSLNGYQTVEDNTTIVKKQTTTITVALPPKHLTGPAEESPEEIVSKTKALEATETQSKYGAIRVASNVSEPVVVVDDRRLGTGNKVYKNISMGKHTIRITKEGYQDWSQKVEVKRGETLKLGVNLPEAETDTHIPQTSEDWIALAQTQMSSHDFSAAVNSYSQALTLDPNSAEALLGRGLGHVQLYDRLKALEDLSNAAKQFIGEGNYSKAIVCYTNLIGLNDRDLESFYNRGFCYLKLGRYQESVSDFEKAIELDKELFLGYLYLGEAHYGLGDYEASLKNYQKAKKLNPHSQQVYVGLAKAYFAEGKKSSAKKSYKKFEELSTYIDRERMKQDPEWRELLKEIGEKAEPEF